MAKPKLALIPAAQGNKFYSVLPSSGVGDFDFTRSGGATRINSQGLIETVADGVSRLNYPLIDGKVVGCPSHLLEPQRLQRIQYSEDFSQSYWNKLTTTIQSNSSISPDGTLNATKLSEKNLTNSNFRLLSGGVYCSGDNTLSIFVKAAERNWVMLRENTQTGAFAFFDIEKGIIGQSSGAENIEIKKFDNGWFRISFKDVLTSVGLDLRVALRDGVSQYDGDGTSGVYIYGAQVEEGSYPTSYIPNYGTAAGVTRSAETANNSGDASTFNDSEGVLMAEISALADDGTARAISISDGGSSDYIQLRYHSVSNTVRFIVNSGGSTNFDYFITLPSTLDLNKIAIKYNNTNVYLWANGIEYFQYSPITNPIGLSELAFDDGSGLNNFYGSTKQIQYFDSALNDSDLETLTSWVSFSDMANGQLYTIE